MKTKIIYSVLSFFFIIIHNQAQDILAFEKKIAEKNSLVEIMQVVNDEYNKLPQNIRDKGGQGYIKEKHWARWAMYMSSRLGEHGSFVNITQKNIEAVTALKKMQSTEKATTTTWFENGPIVSSLSPSLNGQCAVNGTARVDRIAFHPTNPNIIYIGLPAGGIWKTTNGGSSWFPLADFLPSLGVSGIVVSHCNPNIVYALTGDGDTPIGGFVTQFDYRRLSAGVFRSTDGGQTWATTETMSLNPFRGFQLVEDPNLCGTLYAATTIGLYKTTNSGLTWSNILAGNIFDVSIKPASSSVIYAATNTSVRYSTNGGTTWTNSNFTPTAPPSGRKTFAVSEDDDEVLYVLCGGGPNISGQFAGLYKSTNSGQDLFLVRNTPNLLGFTETGVDSTNQSIYDLCITSSHSDQAKIVTGGILAWRSSDSGTNMNITASSCENSPLGYIHADIHDLEYNPLDGKLYAASDGGIYQSSDDGSSWTNISYGISGTQIYHMDKYGNADSRISIGNQDNGIKYKTATGNDYIHVLAADGFYSSIDKNDPSQFYSSRNTSLWLLTNFGDSFTAIATQPDWFQTVECSNTDFNLVLASGDSLFRSTNGGTNWTYTGISASWSLASCPSNNNRFYATGGSWYGDDPNGKAYRSDDDGVSWTDISISSGFPFNFTKLTDIEPRPNNSNEVWMTCGGFTSSQKVYYSSNAGVNWTNRSGSLPNIPINCVAITNNNSVFIGTDIGVFLRAPNANDWVPLSNGLPNVPVTDIRIDATWNQIWASTFGRGVWSAALPDGTCSPTYTVTQNFVGDTYYEASDWIQTSSFSNGSFDNETYLKAGNNITFQPGTHIETNAFLRAYLGPCDTGGIPNNLVENDSEHSLKTTSDKEFNRSNFDIKGHLSKLTIQAHIRKKSHYKIQLLNENHQLIENLKSIELNKGEHQITLKNHSQQVSKMAFIALRDQDDELVYLQEVYKKD